MSKIVWRAASGELLDLLPAIKFTCHFLGHLWCRSAMIVTKLEMEAQLKPSLHEKIQGMLVRNTT